MRTPLSELVAQLRAATDPVERQRRREWVAAAVRDQSLGILRKNYRSDLGADEIEDAAQELAAKLVPLLEEGKVAPGGEEQYVSRSASNRARDLLRRRSVALRRFGDSGVEDTALDDPFGIAERQAELAAMRDLLERALDQLHDNYREVVEAHHFHGVPLKTIAAQWVEDGRAETQAKAEQNVHQAHSRGLKALRRWFDRQRKGGSG